MRAKRTVTALITAAVLCLVLLCSCAGGMPGRDSEQKNAEKVAVLAYHNIVPNSEKSDSSLLVKERVFKRQMRYLARHGFTTLTPEEFYDWYTGKTEVPEKSVLITFDDGYNGVYYLAYPVLKKYGMSATVFAIGHFLEEPEPEVEGDEIYDQKMRLGQVEEIRAEYPDLRIESHTFNMHKKIDGKHPVDVFTYDQMAADIESNEPYGFTYLAYPWGDYNDTFKKALKDKGYKMAFAYDPFYYATRDNDIYAIDRIKIGGGMKMREFKAIVNGKDDDRVRKD